MIDLPVQPVTDSMCRPPECVRRQHERPRAHWVRQHPWHFRWRQLPPEDRVWLRLTARCESGNDAHANAGNGFYGLMQFTLPTASAAGFAVRPDQASWHEQAVRAVRWMHRAGKSQWPACGVH
jgi:hypothetical protein